MMPSYDLCSQIKRRKHSGQYNSFSRLHKENRIISTEHTCTKIKETETVMICHYFNLISSLLYIITIFTILFEFAINGTVSYRTVP